MNGRLSCDDVTRGLAAPAEDGDPAALFEHLASCPACAAGWSARDAAVSRLWDATRPAEPIGATWDALWARVSVGLDRPAGAPEPAVFADEAPAPRWRRFAVRGLVAAQAAALLAAAGLGLTYRAPTPGPLARVAVVKSRVEIDFGEDVLIREDGTKVLTIALRTDDRPNALDGNFAMLNAVEAMAE